MWLVAAAMTPAGAAATFAFGTGVLVQLAAAVAAAVFAEIFCLVVRKKSPLAVADGSAVVCGIIVGLAMPPLAPWWCAAFAAAAGIALAKHCYGGLGNNPFNPAMAGYALAFVSFPAEFAAWPDAAASPTPLLGAQLADPPPPPPPRPFPPPPGGWSPRRPLAESRCWRRARPTGNSPPRCCWARPRPRRPSGKCPRFGICKAAA